MLYSIVVVLRRDTAGRARARTRRRTQRAVSTRSDCKSYSYNDNIVVLTIRSVVVCPFHIVFVVAARGSALPYAVITYLQPNQPNGSRVRIVVQVSRRTVFSLFFFF